MFRLVSSLLLLALLCSAGAELRGQNPARSSTPAAQAQSPTPAASAPPTPSPIPTPTTDSIVDSMSAGDLQQAIQLLKANYINPEALSEMELNRAMLSGVLDRIGRGVMLLPERGGPSPEANSPFFGEIIEGHIGYLRLGALTAPNLQAVDANLQGFAGKKVDAVVVDLRASPATNDFAIASEFAKRFCAKGKLLFTLRKPTAKQERAFTSDRDPAYQGLMIVLADGDTSGPAEAIAGVLRFYNKALIIGQTTAGRAVEYAELPMNGGRMLRVAVAEAVLPEGRPLFPGGLKPDVPVEMPPADKRLVFEQSVGKGMAPFVFENERPHLNEAALLAGRNPELEAMEAAQRRGRNTEKALPRDPVLQRALDVVTSLAIYQKR
jgi:hypothetical protein